MKFLEASWNFERQDAVNHLISMVISDARQNSRFWKGDKIADFDNETKPPILKWDKIADL